MEPKKQNAVAKMKKISSSNTSSKTPVSGVEKNTKNIKKNKSPSRASSSKELTNSENTNTYSIIADRFEKLPLLTLKTEAPNTVKKKTSSARVASRSKSQKFSTTNNAKNKIEKQKNNPSPRAQPSVASELSSLESSLQNTSSVVKIDHEKIYPLLVIFVDYVQELLPNSVKPHSWTPEEYDDLSDELKETIERCEKEDIMDPLITPEPKSEKLKEKNYDETLMEQKLHNLLPIIRKCNGNINYTDKNGQTILHTFIKQYVVKHRILSPEDLLKPEYKNSQEQKFRYATFRVIDELLRKGASVDIADVYGNTPLHTVAEYDGYEEIMKLLLVYYSELDKSEKNGNTVLHLMIAKKEMNEKLVQNIRVLVCKGADMHVRNNEGKAPIHLAFEFCHFEVLSIFEKRMADFNLKTRDGKTSLHLVCTSITGNDEQKIQMIDLLISKGSKVNGLDSDGYSALHYAVKLNSRMIIQRLIQLGADVSCRIKKMNLTPLHLASQFGCSSAINTLIEAGMDVNDVVAGGLIPLHLAILYGKPLTVECLIVNGADVSRRDAIFDFSPTHMTAFVCREKLDLLVNKGADVNVKNRMGISPLHLASMLGNEEVIKSLCEHGADVNDRDNLFGTTALHWATMKGKRLNLNLIAIGKERSENETAMNEFWKAMFLKMCQSCDNADFYKSVHTMLKPNPNVCTVVLKPDSAVIKTLLKFGAHADMQDYDGRIAVYNVVKNDNAEAMKSFFEYGLDFNHPDTSRRILNTWNSVKVRTYILWNAMKLRVARLPVAEIYVSKVVKPQFQCYYGYWEEEVNKMKRYTIDEGVSLYDLLWMKNEFREAYVERVTCLQRDLEANFPGYYSLILSSCRQAAVRMELERSARITLSRAIHDYKLNYFYKCLFSYLNNADLRAFIESVDDAAK